MFVLYEKILNDKKKRKSKTNAGWKPKTDAFILKFSSIDRQDRQRI